MLFIPTYKCRKYNAVVKSRTLPAKKKDGCVNNGRHNWAMVKRNFFIKLVEKILTLPQI